MSYTASPLPDQNPNQVPPSSPFGVPTPPPQKQDSDESIVGKSVLWIVAGVGLFIVCCIIQAACGSSMFSSTYRSTGLLATLLINVTFWPGWIASVGIVLMGLVGLIAGPKKK